ncbi:nucleic-acid-binding protein from transposon X-element [Trichonephila clavipes]|nr:nucleic-acid-binding protein from transposon X-element [Trichonephila clavipes]
MPLFYLQIENGVDVPKIFDFTELFGTRIEVKPIDRGNKINQYYIAEFSEIFREAINARNTYAAWARKLTNAKPSDPDVQMYRQEVKKVGETVEALLVKLNVPLFKIPAMEKALDKIVFRVKNKSVKPLPPKNQEAKTPAVVSPPPLPASPRKGRKAAKRRMDADGFAPPLSSSLGKFALPARPLHAPPPLLPRLLLKTRVWKYLKRIWNFRNQRCKNRSWCPSHCGIRSRTQGPQSLARRIGVEFKSFMLKQDRPVKVVIRGLPSNTEPEDIKTEIEAEGFKVVKISQMNNYRTKGPMPLFYLQIENGVDAPKIFDFTELFGTRVEVKPFDRGNKINQCWRCQGWFHSSEVCHLPPRCVRCDGPHSAKDCTLEFDAPMKCANCSGEHAANWSRCPKHPNNSKRKKIKMALSQ